MSVEYLEPTRLLTTSEAADYFGLKPQTLRKWRSQGGGPPYVRLTRNGPVRYRVADLRQFAEGRTYASTAEEAVSRDDRSEHP